MKELAVGAFLLALPLCAAAQNGGGGRGGQVLSSPMRLPGAITDTGFAGALGRSIQGQPLGPVRGGRPFTPYLLIPPAYPPPPVYYMGFPVVLNQTFVTAPPESAPPSEPPAPAQPPPPVFSGFQAPPAQPENYAPESPVDPQPQASARAAAPPSPHAPSSVLKPTLYLIAARDGSVQMAVAYWYEGGALHYVGKDHEMHEMALDDIDRDLSTQLNSERGIEFHFPE